MTTETFEPASSAELGRLGVLHLKRFWSKCILRRNQQLSSTAYTGEWKIDNTLLAVLGLGLEQTMTYLYNMQPGFDAFENWIMEVNGGWPDQSKIDAFNDYITSRERPYEKPEAADAVLSDADLDFWDQNGYVIIREAVSKEDCQRAVDAICDFIDVKPDDPATWYGSHPARQGIMVQLFQHPALEKNRQSPRIRMAYEQLWGRKDLWVNTDRAGFNPPQTSDWHFPGPHLHWDVSLQLPIPFGLQGILYLADTQANQGAFTLVPGFQNRVESWLNSLPAGANPRVQDLHALGSMPVVANAGDFILWHQALPHGSSPNTSSLPRFVQYINYAPLDEEIHEKWI